jgi:D-tyrosyl-tRNA(Tyr) deacylase
MIALIQRVSQARVRVDGETIGAIGRGLLVLLCAEPGDTADESAALLAKTLALRIFSDDAGKMNRNVGDVGGGLLIVPQFTLAADTSGGNRPSFSRAAPPELGRALFDRFVAAARASHPTVASGAFGAGMQVELVNDGPVTLWLEVSPKEGT